MTYLSYSGFKLYDGCPQAYWHRYIANTPLPEPENRVTMLYGSVVGRIFERFYNEKIWAQKGSEATLLGWVETTINEIILQETRDDKDGKPKGKIVWDDPKLSPKTRYKSRDHLSKDVRESIPRGLAIIRHHRLIGTYARAEVKLDSTFEGHTLGGRADFVIDRVTPEKDRVVTDGKGSKWRESYVDNRQLLWYGLLHREKFGTVPDKLGFVFWRFEPERAVDWIPFVHQHVDELRDKALSTIRQIEQGVRLMPGKNSAPLPEPELQQRLWEAFPPSPSDQCRLCSYQFACKAGQNMSPGRISVPDEDCVGVEEVGFGT